MSPVFPVFIQCLSFYFNSSRFTFWGFPDGSADKKSACNSGDTGDAAPNEMVGGHQQLNGHEFEQAPADSEGQGGLACCSPWGRKESDMTERLNENNMKQTHGHKEQTAGCPGGGLEGAVE